MPATTCYPMASNGLLSLSYFTLVNPEISVPTSFFPFNHRLKSSFRQSSIFVRVKKTPQHLFRAPVVPCLGKDEAGVFPEPREPSLSSDSSKDAVIDIKLPRRSLLVKFTCNACGERSQRFVNRLAYERGTVFVQCAGCFQHHKLVDNLGLVVEYNFQEENNMGPDADQA
ncbi:hypothetical protein M9H77_09669 [Catharanthus roseus]|uniref:Uncharacterized protein n=1 Tax=Catharanthus roseus TaxID=4058 RepID=A0ACC0C1M0_CATRO|nr:hypothetical protein M9H77_09669 [Catharanthus roseus]